MLGGLGGLGGMNPGKMKAMMKQLGINQEEIEADNFAGRYVSRQAIIRSIKNESRSEHEKIVRMKALGD